MLHWIDWLGEVTPCKVCAQMEEAKLNFRPDLDWISDETTLGPELSQSLRKSRTNRPAVGRSSMFPLRRGWAIPCFKISPAIVCAYPTPAFSLPVPFSAAC